MNQYFEFTFLCISTLFSLINPIGIAPIFLTLTERFSINQQRKIAKKGVLTGFLILVIFAYLGTYIFSLQNVLPKKQIKPDLFQSNHHHHRTQSLNDH